MKAVRKILLLLVILVLLFPEVQRRSGLISSPPLKGVFQLNPFPIVTWNSWFSGEFQTEMPVAFNDRIGFRTDLVRLYNQMDFSLFRLAHAEKIVVGKEGYLLAQQYLDAALGTDYVGEALIREKVKLLKEVGNELWRQKRKLLVLVFPPDKGTYYPEYIPERYLSKKKPVTNYIQYRKELEAAGANFLDFNNDFLRRKPYSPYILYPKTGIHWSTYGALLAADSLSRYIESKTGAKLPLMVIDSLVVTDELRSPDGDMGETMNLIWEIQHPDMAYPVIHFDTSQGRKKVNALVVGDSFYWNWYYSGYIHSAFANEDFWYYNKDAYPQNFSSPTSVWDINRIAVIDKANVVIILLVNAGYGNIGYGILEELASYLGLEDPRISEILDRMRSSREWMDALEKKAGERGIPLEEMMTIDARYVIDQQFVEK
ncbi:MAG: hypothetical protein JXA23_12175 [Bacteroidales bacterium]|nr:hypothetical protein [Bacteroidales bacterium]